MTTYTYLPGIGISSMADANLRTTSYEYDGHNRLKRIKDHDGNILEEYSYNYMK
jgi:YD repeat-containing protein